MALSALRQVELDQCRRMQGRANHTNIVLTPGSSPSAFRICRSFGRSRAARGSDTIEV
jgi:hypothetical protein